MNIPEYPNILSISGEGRNVGKTMLACNILSKFGRKFDIYAIKISPHRHTGHGDTNLVYTEHGVNIHEETDHGSGKDSSRMLSSGAVKAWFMEASDENILTGLNFIFKQAGSNSLYVLESGNINSVLKPGISLFVRHLNCQVKNLEKQDRIEMADRIVTFTINSFDINLDNLNISDNKWILSDKNNL